MYIYMYQYTYDKYIIIHGIMLLSVAVRSVYFYMQSACMQVNCIHV